MATLFMNLYTYYNHSDVCPPLFISQKKRVCLHMMTLVCGEGERAVHSANQTATNCNIIIVYIYCINTNLKPRTYFQSVQTRSDV